MVRLIFVRIKTTVVGSWPRHPEALDIILRIQRGEKIPEEEFESKIEKAVAWAISEMASASGPKAKSAGIVGVDVISDGEQSRFGYVDILRKFRGFGTKLVPIEIRDELREELSLVMPELLERTPEPFKFPEIIEPLEYVGKNYTLREISRAKKYLPKGKELFYTVPSPATIMIFYPYSKEAYRDDVEAVHGIAKALGNEYRTVLSVEGVYLQVDDPASAMGYHIKWGEEFFEKLEEHISALNEALKGLPSNRIRLHVCYGNYAGPHVHDVALEKVLPKILEAKVGTLLLEMANPRHEADVEVFKEYETDKIIAIGVIDVKTPIVEHPKVVRKRLVNASKYIPVERLWATTDCGFGTFAHTPPVPLKIAEMKLNSLVEGAYLASKELGLM